METPARKYRLNSAVVALTNNEHVGCFIKGLRECTMLLQTWDFKTLLRKKRKKGKILFAVKSLDGMSNYRACMTVKGGLGKAF